MPERETALLLSDIKIAIEYILQFTKELSLTSFEIDMKTRYAVERNFEIIGEAASRISHDYKNLHMQMNGE